MVTDFDPTAGVDCETPFNKVTKVIEICSIQVLHTSLKKNCNLHNYDKFSKCLHRVRTCKHTQLLKLTSRFLTSSLTLATVSEDCLPLVASFISVDKKFLHFFTFSIVSYKKEND